MNVQLPPQVVYPESDGMPMADNTKQLRWIFTCYGNLSVLYQNRADVFVGGNQFWYPVEGRPDICKSPDVYVVFGRPKGDRGSYKQWEEDNIPLTVVFEILSPANTFTEMDRKQLFYEENGVEEYYVYDPDANHLAVFVRKGEVLRRIRPANGFISPRMGVRFDLSGPDLVIFHSDQRFLTFEELATARVQAEERADQEKQRADQEKQRADQEKQRADHAEKGVARLGELLRIIRKGQASAEEIQELERLEKS
jgi:Uma2 family endonuclease